MKKQVFFKSIACSLIAAFIVSAATAQLKKGNLLVEGSFGNISFSDSKNKYESGGASSRSEGNSFSISLYPRVGFFLTDDFVLGTELGIYGSGSKSDSYATAGYKSSDYKSSSFGLGLVPFARYYFPGTKNTKSRFYGQVGAGVNMDLSNKTDYTYYNASGAVTSKSKYYYPKKYLSFSGNVLAGFNHFITESVALNFNLGYRYTKSTQTYYYVSTNSVGVSTTSPETKSTYNNNGVSWLMGFSMFLPGKKKK